MNISPDEQVLVEELGVTTQGTMSSKDEHVSEKFLRHIFKMDDLNIKAATKKSLQGEYQLLIELFNKVLLPRTKKHIVVTGTDLFLMEYLTKFKYINLFAIMIKYMHKVIMTKEDKHGLAYGLLWNKVFAYFDVECVLGKDGSVK